MLKLELSPEMLRRAEVIGSGRQYRAEKYSYGGYGSEPMPRDEKLVNNIRGASAELAVRWWLGYEIWGHDTDDFGSEDCPGKIDVKSSSFQARGLVISRRVFENNLLQRYVHVVTPSSGECWIAGWYPHWSLRQRGVGEENAWYGRISQRYNRPAVYQVPLEKLWSLNSLVRELEEQGFLSSQQVWRLYTLFGSKQGGDGLFPADRDREIGNYG